MLNPDNDHTPPAAPGMRRRVIDIEDAVRDAVRQVRDLDIDQDGDVVFAVSIQSAARNWSVGYVRQPGGSTSYLPASLSGPDRDCIKIMRAVRALDSDDARALLRPMLGDIDGG